jgi:hypothetical protein
MRKIVVDATRTLSWMVAWVVVLAIGYEVLHRLVYGTWARWT